MNDQLVLKKLIFAKKRLKNLLISDLSNTMFNMPS